MALPIEDYALIGDRGSAALVGKDGSIDWLCLPRFDSPACFAALLGTAENGRWLLAPVDEDAEVSRRYVDDTALLETTFTTATGELVLLDVMPTGDGRADVVRRLTCTRGTVRVRHDWVVRTDYGLVRPWVTREQVGDETVVVAVAGPDKFVLRGPRLPHGQEGHHRDEFDMSAGRRDDVLHHLGEVVARPARAPRPRRLHRGHAPATRRLERARPDRRAPRRPRTPQPADAAADDARGDRRDRRGSHHVAARGLRRRTQLGLPLLLAARRRTHPRVAAGRGLRRGGGRVARLAVARRRRRPGRPADHVHRGRRASAARAGAHPPEGLRRQPPGADRQRRGVAAAERRPRRGDDRPRARPRLPGSRRRRAPGRSSASSSTGSPTTGTRPTTGCGRSAGRSTTSPTPG